MHRFALVQKACSKPISLKTIPTFEYGRKCTYIDDHLFNQDLQKQLGRNWALCNQILNVYLPQMNYFKQQNKCKIKP